VIDPVTTTAATPSAAGTSKSDPAATKGFEQLLLQQLAQEMLQTATTGSGGDSDSDSSDGSGGDATGLGGDYASMLPSAFADAVAQGGGLGL
jgi:hypothetical protein